MPVYPGDPSPSFESFATLRNNGVNLTRITMGSHTGTHIDAPRHYIESGISIDQIPATKLIGEAYVADLTKIPIGGGISRQNLLELKTNIAPDLILVCYTGCSEHWTDQSIWKNYTFLTQDAADYLVSKKVRAVGIDFLSVEKFNAPQPVTHKSLLGHGIFIIESLSKSLKQFAGQKILMVCMPIKVEGGDGAPARVMAIPIRQDTKNRSAREKGNEKDDCLSSQRG